MKKQIQRLIKDEKGANLVEYIILVGVVALIAIAGFSFFGEEVEKKVDAQAKAVGDINSEAKK